jgi:AraC-like DNA-binding protein
MAQREISFGAKPTDVYVKCGFSDYSTFYRAYKNQFGKPPSEKGDTEHTIVVHDDGTSRNPHSIV